MECQPGARFKLFLACSNCLRRSSKTIISPPVEGAPQDVDELVGSAFLDSQAFRCAQCDSTIAEIVGISQVFEGVAA